MFFKAWDVVKANEIFGTLGNTGNVTDINGNKPSAQQLANGVWSHIDIVVTKADGTKLSSRQVESYLSWIKWSTDNLSSTQKIQWDALAVKIYGKRAGAKPENQEKVYELLGEEMTIDEVEDTIRLWWFGAEFSGTAKSAFDNISSKMSKDLRGATQAVLEDKIKEFGADSEQVKGYYKKLARDTMDADARKKVKGYELLDNAMVDIKNDLKRYEKLWGDTNIFVGKKEKVAGKIGKVSDPEIAKLANKIQKTIQVYRQGVSGAAFTESESLEYKAIFPSSENTAALNSALIESLLESNTISIDTAYQQQIGISEYDEIFKWSTQNTSTTTNSTQNSSPAFTTASWKIFNINSSPVVNSTKQTQMQSIFGNQ